MSALTQYLLARQIAREFFFDTFRVGLKALAQSARHLPRKKLLLTLDNAIQHSLCHFCSRDFRWWKIATQRLKWGPRARRKHAIERECAIIAEGL